MSRAHSHPIAPRDPVDAPRALNERRIYRSLLEGAIGLSPHCFNTIREIRRALDVCTNRARGHARRTVSARTDATSAV